MLVREVHDDQGEKVGEENPWGISFKQGLFNMASDSHLFRTREELEADGFTLRQPGNHFVRGEAVLLPLYEPRMMHQFTHRHGTYAEVEDTGGRGRTNTVRTESLRAPASSALPRYWVRAEEVDSQLSHGREWLLGYRNITNVTNERTVIFSPIPRAGVGHNMPVVSLHLNSLAPQFVADMNSFALDYAARQKVGKPSIDFYVLEQFPIIPPDGYSPEQVEFISGRVLELTYTAWDIKAFAEDMGDEGPPFVWDEERRAQLRAQLDALYFHLYGIERADVEYIMGTFPIVERKDRARFGCYRTCELILGYYDAYGCGDMEVWLGEEGKREAQRHGMDTRPHS